MNSIKKLREAKKMSQAELAKKANISQAAVHYIESGQKSPTLKVLTKIAKALEVELEDLISSHNQ